MDSTMLLRTASGVRDAVVVEGGLAVRETIVGAVDGIRRAAVAKRELCAVVRAALGAVGVDVCSLAARGEAILGSRSDAAGQAHCTAVVLEQAAARAHVGNVLLTRHARARARR